MKQNEGKSTENAGEIADLVAPESLMMGQKELPDARRVDREIWRERTRRAHRFGC